ncbi:hypothetical protein ACSU64_05660 [Bacillaceae bacterium C204]|uniref:hypothetical protein n=1 Tax=Neobacillus sp. 204 TaxID=3383351 RepID=UPI00397C6FE1
MATQNKNVYILSLEGNEIYSHMHREKEIDLTYKGMIPFSLELIKLKQQKEFSTFKVKTSEKNFSNDIINVKFKQSVKSGEFLIKQLTKKINDENTSENYKQKLNEFKNVLLNEKPLEKWQGLSNDKLREYLYLNGFTITDDKGIQTKYVVYKRSSSKSRTGQCLFIKESLHEEMINWSRMYLPFTENMEIDYASLLAYESLVLSSIEDTIEINPKHILIVDDVESKFDQICNVVKKDEKKKCLDSFKENVEVVNSLFDGESLLDSKYFDDGQSMKLLRNHMFKSAAFNTNIQKFLKDNCPVDTPYDEWELADMFNYPILAKDVELIITPSSLKALRFSQVFEGEHKEKQMWNYWQGLVDKEGNHFGVCKSEKKSKRGIDAEGNVLQQTSYQMLNSIPMEKEDIAQLVTFEKDYIEKLKNNDEFFIRYIIDNANDMNSNLMFADLYKWNKEIVNIRVFRDFRKSEINKYVTHVKKGKVRLSKGDYCVMLGNPMEFLYHAIGQFDVEKSKLALKDNEVYSPLFADKVVLTGFRNPHTSPSNVLKAKNTYNKDIATYFNLSDNIVCVNAVRFAIQDILSGCDYDSDSVLLFDSEHLRKISENCYGKFHVCVNKVESQKKPYMLNNLDMSNIDNQLAASQDYIGTVVNLGQLCMSRYWDLKEKDNVSKKILDSLMRKTDVMTVLSGIAIDMSKKFFEIDIEKEIKNVEEDLILRNKKVVDKKGNDKNIPAKPMFFKYVSQNKNIKNKVVAYNCPMDYLYEEMSNLPYADHHEDVEFTSLLVKRDKRKGNRKQKKKILNYVENMNTKINKAFDKFEDGKERNNAIEDVIKYYDFYMQKLEVKPDTMFSILDDMRLGKLPVKLLNVLYQTQKQAFLNAFKQG